MQRKKFVDEAKTLSEEISKLNELLSSKKLIFQVSYLQIFQLSLFSCLSACMFTTHVTLALVLVHMSSLSSELYELLS